MQPLVYFRIRDRPRGTNRHLLPRSSAPGVWADPAQIGRSGRLLPIQTRLRSFSFLASHVSASRQHQSSLGDGRDNRLRRRVHCSSWTACAVALRTPADRGGRVAVARGGRSWSGSLHDRRGVLCRRVDGGRAAGGTCLGLLRVASPVSFRRRSWLSLRRSRLRRSCWNASACRTLPARAGRVSHRRAEADRSARLRSPVVQADGAPAQAWEGYYGEGPGGKPHVRALCRATDGGTKPMKSPISGCRSARSAGARGGVRQRGRRGVSAAWCDALARTEPIVVQLRATPDGVALPSLGQFSRL